MIKYIEKLDSKTLMLIKAFVFAACTVMTYSILLCFMSVVGFSWVVFPIIFGGIMVTIIASISDDRFLMTPIPKKYNPIKTLYLIIDFLILWTLIYAVVLQVKLDTFTIILFAISFVAFLTKTIFSLFTAPKIFNLVNDFQAKNRYHKENKTSDYDFAEVTGQSIAEMNKASKTAIFTLFIPVVIAFVAIVWGFYRIGLIINIPVGMKVYIAFALVFSSILSTIT